MKIVLTTHQFLPDFFSGTEILTYETARGLMSRGHDVHVVTGYPGGDDLPEEARFDRYVHEGIPVERFRHACVPMGEQSDANEAEFNNRFVSRHLRRYLADLRPDVVHVFHLARLSASVIDVCYELGIPVVMTPTDFWLICAGGQLRLPDNSICTGPDASGFKCMRHMEALAVASGENIPLARVPDLLMRGLMVCNNLIARFRRPPVPYLHAFAQRTAFLASRMNRLAKVIVPTRLMERILVEHGLAEERVVFSRFGINTSTITPRLRAGGDVMRVGFIGQLAEHKGAHVLVGAIRSFPPKVPLELKIFGDTDSCPEYVSRLRTLIADDQRIAFYGTFANDQIGEVLDEMDVLIVPSIWYENTPLVIYSAQAAACPVIASNLGGMSEVVIDEENGLLFPPGDSTGLSQIIGRLLDDGTLLSRLSARTRRPKGIEEYVDDVLTVYGDVTTPKSMN